MGLHFRHLLIEGAIRAALNPLLTQRGLVLLQLARLHLLTAVGALPAGVQLLLVLLELPARHRLVANRAESDVAGAVQRVHHVARGRDVPAAGEEGTIYERAFCQETRILTSSNPGTLSLVRGPAAEAAEPPLNWEFTRGRVC